MSPVKIALVAILFVAFACADADVAKEEIDTMVPELAEQQHSDDEMAQASPTSDDEMAQASPTDDEMQQQEAEMDQLPKGVTEEQLAQATDEQKAAFWGRRRRRRSYSRRRRRRRRRSGWLRHFSAANRSARRRSSLAQEEEPVADEMDQIPKGVTEEDLAQASDEQKATWAATGALIFRRRRSYGRRRSVGRRRMAGDRRRRTW
eukprot:TRINITY_DN1937_c0_g1_i4.p1 TRINITY_DN1937_c0_g1~~TRINITY_DN1937_c0_g1_i4.p1  ORF type:complete len:205 (+),score=56.20 TRINITY_DN1937_c0_g1_i4:212-826(+)